MLTRWADIVLFIVQQIQLTSRDFGTTENFVDRKNSGSRFVVERSCEQKRQGSKPRNADSFIHKMPAVNPTDKQGNLTPLFLVCKLLPLSFVEYVPLPAYTSTFFFSFKNSLLV